MIPNEINKLIGNWYIIGNKLRIQTLNSVMCGYFYIGFIDFILNEKILTDSVGLKLFDIWLSLSLAIGGVKALSSLSLVSAPVWFITLVITLLFVL